MAELTEFTQAQAWQPLPNSETEIFIDGELASVLQDQRWYWGHIWQAGEAEATEDIRLGRITRYESGDSFLASL